MAKGNFGERLKRERELREVSLKELTTGTRISERYLQAFESEDWNRLPGGAFNRGFVRSIARYLGLDEENFLAEYDLAFGDQNMPAPKPYENKIPRPPIWIPLAMLLGALLILCGLVAGGVYGYRRFLAHRAAKQSSSASSLQTPGSSTSAASPAGGSVVPIAATGDTAVSANSPDAPLDLFIATASATHVRVVADDGTVLLDRDLPSGDTRHLAARRQFEVTVADSASVLLELNGKTMPPIGTPGASGTIVLSHKDLRQTPVGTQP